MEIDHLFIFSSRKGQEVDDLVDVGFTEGSGRVHPGQGTMNRKIYFENFYLEIVWVRDESEIKSDNLLKTKLWERSNFLLNGCSPFGLGFMNTPDTHLLFEQAIKYQPDYFPEGISFDIITNEQENYLPWTFRPPLINSPNQTNEPTAHQNGIKKLTRTIFELNATVYENWFTKLIENNSPVNFQPGTKNTMTLEFDNGVNGKSKIFDALNLVIKF